MSLLHPNHLKKAIFPKWQVRKKSFQSAFWKKNAFNQCYLRFSSYFMLIIFLPIFIFLFGQSILYVKVINALDQIEVGLTPSYDKCVFIWWLHYNWLFDKTTENKTLTQKSYTYTRKKRYTAYLGSPSHHKFWLQQPPDTPWGIKTNENRNAAKMWVFIVKIVATAE